MKIIGRSGEGRPIYMKTLGTGKYKVWFISGQHWEKLLIHGWQKVLSKDLWRENKMFKNLLLYCS